MKKIGILGSGMVGKTLADGFIKYGYQVKIGTGNPSKLEEWKSDAGENGSVGSFAQAAEFGDAVVLAVKGHVAKQLISGLGEALEGKLVMDACNPIDENNPPVNGVLHFYTKQNSSMMEELQESHPKAKFVKVFSSVGAHLMVNPDFGGQKPSMFICGNDDEAKGEVRKILDMFGWETEDMGTVEAARAIEPLCMLWCIPGFKDGKWNHAYKLLRNE